MGGEGNGDPLQYSCLENPMDGGAWWAAVHGVTGSPPQLRDFTFTFHFHALEKEMATRSGVLAWRIPGTGEPGGLPSMVLHRVGHDWSDLAAAAAALVVDWEHSWTRSGILFACVSTVLLLKVWLMNQHISIILGHCRDLLHLGLCRSCGWSLAHFSLRSVVGKTLQDPMYGGHKWINDWSVEKLLDEMWELFCSQEVRLVY